MLIFKSKSELAKYVAALKHDGVTIAFVPTMGALHQGHASLILEAKKHSEVVVCSIFVNPKQFSENEDFSIYPRTIEADIDLLKSIDCDILYLPQLEEIYPAGFHDYIEAGPVGKIFEGKVRPHFFGGVLTVVKQLFLHVSADVAVFGEKDFQQLFLVTRMAKELFPKMKIVAAPIIREESGLAMSSRNKYLSDKDRKNAAIIYQVMSELSKRLRLSNKSEVLNQAKISLLDAGFSNVDYIELIDPKTFNIVDKNIVNARLLVAAKLSNVRLIDNIDVNMNI